ncbi:MAG: hypothetical protein ACJ71D_13595 [Nitrososphaera sp.]
MQTRNIVIFGTIVILVGTIVSMATTSGIAAAQTIAGASSADNNTDITRGINDAAQVGNVTSAGGTNLSTSEIRTNLEQARTALQNNDTQTAIMYLNLTLDAMGNSGATEGNITSGSSSTTAGGIRGDGGGNTTTTGSEEGGISMGGTGAADDYDGTADD